MFVKRRSGCISSLAFIVNILIAIEGRHSPEQGTEDVQLLPLQYKHNLLVQSEPTRMLCLHLRVSVEVISPPAGASRKNQPGVCQ